MWIENTTFGAMRRETFPSSFPLLAYTLCIKLDF